MIAATALLHKDLLDDALLAMLDVWRATRDPRVAKVVDLLSARLTPNVAPMPGKTVDARDDAWRKLAAKKQPRDVPRLLAALWPKQWRDARPLLDLLDRFPDDPRIAAFLVRTVVEPPYTSGASEAFFKLAYASIGKLGDRRGLEALATLENSLAKDAVAAIERRTVTPVDDAAVKAAEAYFAADVARAGADADRGAALLAAIYEAPDDDGPRAVYADWLVERGDKRGEFIALQLARGSAGEPTKRERDLLHDHERAWAGELGKAFRMTGRRFERGFFAGGQLDKDSVARLQDDPAARLITYIHTLEQPALVVDLVRHLPSLRELSCGIGAAVAIATREQVMPRLTELAARPDGHAPGLLEKLARCEALPALHTLDVFAMTSDEMRWLLDASVLDRVEHLRIGGEGVIRELVDALLRRTSALRTVELARASWTANLVRAMPGEPFETCRLKCGDPQTLTRGLDTILDVLPSDLKRIDVALSHPLDAARKASLEPALARFAPGTIDLPTMVPRAAADAPVLQVRISGRGFLDPDGVEAMWKLLADAGQSYDSFVVGDGKAVKPLGDDPIGRIAKWALNEKTEKIALCHSARRDRALLCTTRSHPRFGNLARHNELDLVTRNGVAGVPALFVHLVKLAESDWALCDVIDRPRTFVHFERKPIPIGWLSLVMPDIASRIALDAIAGDGISVVRDGDVTILVSAPTPAEATGERVALVASRLRALGCN